MLSVILEAFLLHKKISIQRNIKVTFSIRIKTYQTQIHISYRETRISATGTTPLLQSFSILMFYTKLFLYSVLCICITLRTKVEGRCYPRVDVERNRITYLLILNTIVNFYGFIING